MPRRKRRRYGSGGVFPIATKRDDGTERVRWVAQLAVHVDGKRRYLTRWRPSEDAAKAALADLIAAQDDGRPPDSAVRPLDQWLTAWLASLSVRDATLTSYAGHVRMHIRPVIGMIPLGDLRAADVRRLIADRQAAGKSPATIRRILTTLSMALEMAVRERVIAHNVAREVRPPKVQRKPVEAMTPDTARRVLDATAGTWVERPVRVWLGSGLRRGEVLGLDQGDLMLDAGYVRVRRSKTTVRAVPVSDDAVAALREALAAAPRVGAREPVFYSPRTGDRMRGDSVTHALRELTGMTPHALRHGVATMMVAQGVHMRVVADQLGHADPSMTARVYAHVVPEHQREAIRALDLTTRQSG